VHIYSMYMSELIFFIKFIMKYKHRMECER
jgi:hypothetical protein